jgi:hypothetical protein
MTLNRNKILYKCWYQQDRETSLGLSHRVLIPQRDVFLGRRSRNGLEHKLSLKAFRAAPALALCYSSPAQTVIGLNLSDPKAPTAMEESSSRLRLTS